MFKKSLTLIASALIAFNAAATNPQITNASEEIECYPLAHGENGQGSRNSIYVLPFTTEGSHSFNLAVTNIGGQAVNVILELYDENGQLHEPTSGVTYDGNFSSVNSPIRKLDGTGAAELSSFNVGAIAIDSNYPSYLTGRLTWQADSCLQDATVVAKVTAISTRNGHIALQNLTTNGGNPF